MKTDAKVKMEIEIVDINKIIPYVSNPRKNDMAVDHVAASIKEFGWQQPLVVDKENVIVVGHTRLMAARRLGIKEVPVIVARNLTDAQIKAYRIVDNKTAEFAEWDFDLLGIELKDLVGEIDMTDFGYEEQELDAIIAGINAENFGEEGNSGIDGTYTKKIKAPLYEPTGEKPEVEDLFDKSKTEKLIEEIEVSDIKDNQLKNFLIEAAQRHTIFRYDKVAEFYAHADKNVQELMEKSALVIIDFDKAIEYGFTKLSERLSEQYTNDQEDQEG